MPKKKTQEQPETSSSRNMFDVDVMVGNKIISVITLHAFSTEQAEMFAKSSLKFKSRKHYAQKTEELVKKK